jgi:uncharacterized membrane protein
MTAFVIANLLGRLLASYIIVWLVMFVVSRFDWRTGFRKTHRCYGIVSIVIVFVLGVAGGASRFVV